MVRVQRVFEVDKPPADVVRYLSDFSNTEEWDPGTVACWRMGEGAIGVGARWHNVSKLLGSKTELTYELTRLEPDRVTFVGTNKTARTVDDLSVSPAGSGARITYRATIELVGWAKVAEPLMKLVFEHLGNAVVRSLAGVLSSTRPRHAK
ncbi:polyketide cyclase [Actinosynnema sp. ALI-1.44]|uniref:SRPBCC family protein n=1 Tax=Actinosynnema sp. ALI-1.44 TaxID=1933779 RepID=UPI00097C4096|nr:SRPBCC family protein [Actinosynnema sp. ALI-1.44]ONI85392.1 polyketide cyclase [Actinosynnema sp. ALI-1.44]